MGDERKAVLEKFSSAMFRKSAQVQIGEPNLEFKKKVQELTRKQKQEASDKEFAVQLAEAKKKREWDRKQREIDRARKKAEKEAAKAEKKRAKEEAKKAEEEKKKAAEAAAAAEKPADGDKPAGEEKKEGEEKSEVDEKKEGADGEKK